MTSCSRSAGTSEAWFFSRSVWCLTLCCFHSWDISYNTLLCRHCHTGWCVGSLWGVLLTEFIYQMHLQAFSLPSGHWGFFESDKGSCLWCLKYFSIISLTRVFWDYRQTDTSLHMHTDHVSPLSLGKHANQLCKIQLKGMQNQVKWIRQDNLRRKKLGNNPK